MGIVVLVVVLAVGATIAYFAHRANERAKQRALAFARQHGFRIDLGPKGPMPIDFDLFDIGRAKQVRTQMWRDGQPHSVFQYRYTTGSGKNSRTYHYSCALVATPFHSPHLEIGPEGWWASIARAIGVRDIELESPEFNDLYRVRSDDERFAVTLLDPPMIAWMLRPVSGRGSVRFEYLGPWMLCIVDRLDLEQLPGLLDWATSVIDELPTVLADLYPRH